MNTPAWMKNIGSSAAIALSSLPILLSIPGVIDAHNALNREVERVHAAPAATGTTASVAVAGALASIVLVD